MENRKQPRFNIYVSIPNYYKEYFNVTNPYSFKAEGLTWDFFTEDGKEITVPKQYTVIEEI